MGRLRWYKRDPRAALIGMAGLTLEERGAYNALLDLVYAGDGSFPNDERVICKMLGINRRRWKRLRDSLIAKGKIYLNGNRLHNERADSETSDAFDRVARKAQRRHAAQVSRKFGESFVKVSRNMGVSPELKQILSEVADRHNNYNHKERVLESQTPRKRRAK